MGACKYRSMKKLDSKWEKEANNLEKASPSILSNVKIKNLQVHTPEKHKEEIQCVGVYMYL